MQFLGQGRQFLAAGVGGVLCILLVIQLLMTGSSGPPTAVEIATQAAQVRSPGPPQPSETCAHTAPHASC